MPSSPAAMQPADGHPSAGAFEQRDGLTGLLRNAHIFSSAVRDVLEVELLRQVTSHPLSPSQFNLLKLISGNGRHRVGDIARMFGVSAAAATKTVDKLERLGLVNRLPSPDDRRATLLVSSPAGRRLVADYEAVKEERLLPVLDDFSDAELDRLGRLLDRLSVGLLSDRDRTDGGFCLRCCGYYDPQCSLRRLGVRCPYATARKRARTA